MKSLTQYKKKKILVETTATHHVKPLTELLNRRTLLNTRALN